MCSSQNAGPGPGPGPGPGVGVGVSLFFSKFFCFNFCRYSPVLLFSNVRHLSFIYGGNYGPKNMEHLKATKGTYLFFEIKRISD